MAKNEVKNKYNSEYCIRQSYDEEAKALKTIPSEEMAFSIELDHKDGDSVISVPHHIHSKELMKPINIEEIRKVSVYCKTGNVKVEISPSPDEDYWYQIANLFEGEEMENREVTACRIRLKREGGMETEAYLVGRS